MGILFAFLLLKPIAWAMILVGWIVYTWRPKKQWGAAVVAVGLFIILMSQFTGMLPAIVYFLGGEIPDDWYSSTR